MQTYRVTWEETNTYEKWVEAKDEREAQEIAYENSSFSDISESEVNYDSFQVEVAEVVY